MKPSTGCLHTGTDALSEALPAKDFRTIIDNSEEGSHLVGETLIECTLFEITPENKKKILAILTKTGLIGETYAGEAPKPLPTKYSDETITEDDPVTSPPVPEEQLRLL